MIVDAAERQQDYGESFCDLACVLRDMGSAEIARQTG